MQLPELLTSKRFTAIRPPGSADAAFLAALISREIAKGRRTAIFTADAFDAQRLMDELVFFAPDCRCVLFPDWETLPYDNFSPHQDLISERLATLWRISQGEADVVMVPATTALYKLAPPAFLAPLPSRPWRRICHLCARSSALRSGTRGTGWRRSPPRDPRAKPRSRAAASSGSFTDLQSLLMLKFLYSLFTAINS